MANEIEPTSAQIAYGRFSRRLRAFVIDWFIIVTTLVTALLVAVSTGSDRAGRILGFTFVAAWLFYEPLLVSIAGSTVGHYFCNLRVVDDKSQGNVSFLKAVARLAIKSVLGIYSFITMATTQRHQALHDLMTRSTVQIRNRSNATSSEYAVENTEFLNPSMPSRLRRALIIVCYSVGSYVLFAMIVNSSVSRACRTLHRCSSLDNAFEISCALIFIAVFAFALIQGWRGRLLGCRLRSAERRS